MADAGKKGMETEKVKAIAARLDVSARNITEAINKAEGASKALEGRWHGSDAETFFTGWPAHRAALEEVAKAVEEMRKTLRQQIQDQQVTSEAVGGAGGGGNGDGSSGGGNGDGSNGGGNGDGSNGGGNGDGSNGGGNGEDGKGGPVWKGKVKDDIKDPADKERRTYSDATPKHRDDSDGDRKDKTYENKEGKNWQRGREHERNFGKKPIEPPPDPNENPYKPKPELNVDLVEGSAEGQLGPSGEWLGDRNGNYLGYDFLKGEVKGSAGVTMSGDAIKAGASASASVIVAGVSGAYKNQYGTSVTGNAYVGAEANADVGVSYGKNGLEAGAHASAFVGGKADVSVTQSVGPVDVGAGAEISYGLGAHADIDAGFSKDHVGVSVDIGATLGLGVGVSFDIGFDPPW